MEFRFFQKFSDVRTFTNHPLPPSEISKPPLPICRTSFVDGPLSVTYFNQKLSLMCLTHMKIGYFCLLSSIILKNISLGHATRKYHILKLESSKLARILCQLLLFLLIINVLLIGIINPGLLKICYQNVQGLIPIKDLTLKQPSLNITKICELNAYININRPDVIMLNETWLKKSVKR